MLPEMLTCAKHLCDKVRLKIVADTQNSHKIVAGVSNPSRTLLNLVFVRKKAREV